MGKCRKSKGLAAAVLALALLAGCAGTGQEPGVEPPAGQSAPEEPALDGERLAVLEEAEEWLKGYLWPRETVVKDILGQEMEFVLYHGNGWTIHVPTSWESEGVYSGIWSAPSHNAGFQVGKQFLGVNNPKWYRAQTGSWRHETDYDPPFDYYYDNDGGYTPPEGFADYIYFFAPDGDDRSYEFTLSLVVGETTQEERAIQEAMLLSFRLDDSSHVLYSGDYTPGRTQWESAAAGLLAESEPVWFFWSQDGQSYDLAGKASPDYLPHAMEVADYQPGEFVQTFFGEGPEGGPVTETGDEIITLLLPEIGVWLYFYENSPWVCVHHASEDYWAEFRRKDGSDKLIYDAVLEWREAGLGWGAG